LARDWVARVDAYAAKRKVNRSDAIRGLLETALASDAAIRRSFDHPAEGVFPRNRDDNGRA
jgi:hypothetical protein